MFEGLTGDPVYNREVTRLVNKRRIESNFSPFQNISSTYLRYELNRQEIYKYPYLEQPSFINDVARAWQSSTTVITVS